MDIRNRINDGGNWIYLVVGPNTWGKGFSERQAFDAAGKPKRYVTYVSSDPWVSVDDLGGIVYMPVEGPDEGRFNEDRKPHAVVAYKSERGHEVEIDGERSKASGKRTVLDARFAREVL